MQGKHIRVLFASGLKKIYPLIKSVGGYIMNKRKLLENLLFSVLIPILLQAGFTLLEAIRTSRSIVDIVTNWNYLIFSGGFIMAYVVVTYLVVKKTPDSDDKLIKSIENLVSEIQQDREERKMGLDGHE